MVEIALQAAEELAGEGIEAEVIDPRTLVPLDIETIAASVKKTHRVVVVHEAHERVGFGAEIVAQVVTHAFDYLDAPPLRLANPNVADAVQPRPGGDLNTDAAPGQRRRSRAARVEGERMATAVKMPQLGVTMTEAKLAPLAQSGGGPRRSGRAAGRDRDRQAQH